MATDPPDALPPLISFWCEPVDESQKAGAGISGIVSSSVSLSHGWNADLSCGFLNEGAFV